MLNFNVQLTEVVLLQSLNSPKVVSAEEHVEMTTISNRLKRTKLFVLHKTFLPTLEESVTTWKQN